MRSTPTKTQKVPCFYMRPPDSKSPSLASVQRRFQARQTSRTPESREGPNLARVVVSHIGGPVLWYYVNFWTDWFRHLSPSSPMVISEIQKIQNRFVRDLVPAEDSSVRSRARLQMPLARVLSLLPSFGHGRGEASRYLHYIQGKPMAEFKTGAGTWFRVRRDAASREVECARYSHVRPLNGIDIAFFHLFSSSLFLELFHFHSCYRLVLSLLD